MRRPLADVIHNQISDVVNNGIRADPRIVDAIRAARGAPGLDAFQVAIATGASLLHETDGGRLLGRSGCVQLIYDWAVVEFPVNEAGEAQPVAGHILSDGFPGIEGRPVWILGNVDDVKTLRSELAPGQVWIRSDLVKSDQWPAVRAVAMDAATRMLGQTRSAGRRKGSQNVARAALLERIRADPGLSTEAIDAMGIEAEIWEDMGGDNESVARRVARARLDASK